MSGYRGRGRGEEQLSLPHLTSLQIRTGSYTASPRGPASSGEGPPGPFTSTHSAVGLRPIDIGRGDGGPARARGGFTGSPRRSSYTSSPISPPYSSDPPPGIFAPNQPAPVDSRLMLADQDALVANFKRLHLSGDFPHRPGWGTDGLPIKLRANFFPVQYPRTRLFDYVVKVEPQASVKRVRKRIYQLLEQTPEFLPFKDHIVHDSGGRLISSQILPIPDAGVVIRVPFSEEDVEIHPKASNMVYTITVVYSGQLDTVNLQRYLEGDPAYRGFDPSPLISAFNIIVAFHPARSGINVGRNRFFFHTPGNTYPLGNGLEAWKGYYSSIRPTFKQLMINVNVCTTAFYKPGNLAQAMIEFLKGGSQRLGGFVKGLRIETSHLGFKCRKTIKRLGERSARQETFICAEYGNAMITVEQYFRRKYERVLRHAADLPLIDVGSSKDRPILLPAELCMICPNQPFRGKLTDDATTAMIRHACKAPNYNAQSIVNNGLPCLGLQTAAQLKEFNINIGDKMSVLPGRILAPPTINYGRGSVKIDERASWNVRDVQFMSPMPLHRWGILVLRDNGRADFAGANDPALRIVVEGFQAVCKKIGMHIMAPPQVASVNLPPKDPRLDHPRSNAIDAIESTLLQMRNPTIVLVMLSNGDKSIYSGLKRLCDIKLDIHTVCCHSQKIRQTKGQLQYWANIALKVNVKLGGVNHTVDTDSLKWLRDQSTMLIGSDVTHPSPGSAKGSPSIAAVVASIDDRFVHYPASLRLQEGRKEMITDLADMVQERLLLYFAKNRALPAKILFFRDGVSEGQYLTVVQDELPKVKEACRRMEHIKGPYRPKITLCIAGKRHHTRFYPTEAGAADKNGNPRPGTVVDRGVTAIYDFDFFLQAHGGLQGTTRPTHYYVVHDENNFTADTIQKLTNCTSYLFARATRAVSLVPPAYYADLACERGRCYIHELLNTGDSGSNNSNGPGGSESDVLREARKQWDRGPGPKLRETMFYL